MENTDDSSKKTTQATGSLPREVALDDKLWEAELERRDRAAARLREEFLSSPSVNPYYIERDKREGMRFWRMMHSGAVLSD